MNRFRINRPNEAVAAAGYRFDIGGSGGGIAQGLADFVYRGVEAVIEINKGVAGPELVLKVFAGKHFSGTFQ